MALSLCGEKAFIYVIDFMGESSSNSHNVSDRLCQTVTEKLGVALNPLIASAFVTKLSKILKIKMNYSRLNIPLDRK